MPLWNIHYDIDEATEQFDEKEMIYHCLDRLDGMPGDPTHRHRSEESSDDGSEGDSDMCGTWKDCFTAPNRVYGYSLLDDDGACIRVRCTLPTTRRRRHVRDRVTAFVWQYNSPTAAHGPHRQWASSSPARPLQISFALILSPVACKTYNISYQSIGIRLLEMMGMSPP